MEFDDPEAFDRVAQVVKGFSNTTRLALLTGLYYGYDAPEIAAFLDMTRGGLQSNIQTMIEADLIYRPADDDAPTYQLTPLGEYFAQYFSKTGPTIQAVSELLDRTEGQVEQELHESPLGDGLTATERQKLVHTKKWAASGDEVANHLARLQLELLVADLLTEDTIETRTVETLTRLVRREPDVLLPLLPKLVEFIEPGEHETERKANALLVITELINSHPQLADQTLLERVPLRYLSRTVEDIVDSYLPVAAYLAHVLLAALSIDPQCEPEQAFKTVTRVENARQITIQLHQLLHLIAEAYENRGTLNTEKLADYRALHVQPHEHRKPTEDHQTAVIALARALDPYLSHAREEALPNLSVGSTT